MKRVMEGGDWTLFSPSDVPDLHDMFGRGVRGGLHALRGQGRARRDQALQDACPPMQLWRKMLSMLFETGHPWITFKDPCNVRSPQQHVGVVHSSNLCTEITLNTSDAEIAVCNLGSVNLVAAPDATGGLDQDKLQAHHRAPRCACSTTSSTSTTTRWRRRATRNLRHRPVGPGHHGLPGLPAPSCACPTPRTRRSSSPTARWRRCATTPTGPRPSWPRSAAATRAIAGILWDRGVLPQDTLDLLAEAARRLRRGRPLAPRSTGTPCARASRSTACATRNCLAIAPDRDHRQHHRRVAPRSSPPTRTSTSNPTCRASSPSSTSTWCAT